MAKIHVTTTINGAPTEYLCDPNQTLLDVLRVAKAEKALVGSKLDDKALEAAAAACSEACKPIDDKRGTIKYRTKIAGVLLKRVALIARDRVKGVEHHMHDQWA